jgi:hypothetical protein
MSDWRKQSRKREAALRARISYSNYAYPSNHSDRDRVREEAEEDFLGLYLSMGGVNTEKKALHCIFHQDENPSAEIWQGKYHCWSCGVRLDPFEFVMEARCVNFREALEFLAHRYCVPLGGRKMTHAELLAFYAEERAAEAEARKLVNWKEGLLYALRQLRNIQLAIYYRGLRLIVQHSLRHPLGSLWADVTDAYEAKYQETEQRITVLQNASYATLLPYYRARREA